MPTTSRKPKWHLTPPPPPSPKILHFPRTRRPRRKHPRHHHRSDPLLLNPQCLYSRGNLENQENDELPKTNEAHVVFFNSHSRKLAVERRERVEEEYFGECDGGGAKGFAEEKWRFQAEILRAECNFLRMERELALKKLERNRVKMERTLRSAVQTLVSGRKEIFEGKNVNAVLERKIEDLSEKLEELHKSSRIKDNEFYECSNFDKKVCLLQHRLENLGQLSDENRPNEPPRLTESSSSTNTQGVDKHSILSNREIENKSTELDELSKKMEGLSSNCLLDRVEQKNCSMVSSTANSSLDASSASISKGIACPNLCSFSTRQLHQEPILHEDNRCCSGHCKAIIHSIVEQVRAETEQWSQMQEMLEQVRSEMEELQASRDFWENRAHNSNQEIQSLKHAVEEWKEKAHGYETKANELQQEVSVLKEELQKSKAELNLRQQKEAKSIPDPPGKQHSDEKPRKFENELNTEANEEQKARAKELPAISLGKQLAKEKIILLQRLKEKQHDSELSSEGRRKPLRDIGNSSLFGRQNGAVFAFHSPESKFQYKRKV